MVRYTHKQLGELVRKVQSGDQDAFTELYAATYKIQYYLAISNLKNPSLAEDAVQELYINLYNKIDQVKYPEQIVAFLNTSNYNICLRLLEKEKMSTKSDIADFEPIIVDNKPTPAQISNLNGDKEAVKMALSQLDSHLSSVLVMRYVDEMKIEDIAQAANKSSRTIKRYLKQGVVEMKKILDKLKYSTFSFVFMQPVIRKILANDVANTVSAEKGNEMFNNIAEKTGMASSNATKVIATTAIASTAFLSSGTALAIGTCGALGVAVTAGAIASPAISISTYDQTNYTNEAVSVSIKADSLLPNNTIVVYDSNNQEYASCAKAKECTFTIADNDTYTVEATLFNGQSSTETFTVNNIDVDAPNLGALYDDGSSISFAISDSKSGIDYSSISLTDAYGNSVDYSLSNDTISYSNEYTLVHIIVDDNLGNEISSDITYLPQ